MTAAVFAPIRTDARWLGTLTCHQLNILLQDPCCPRCCAPCDTLQQMLDSGSLNRVVKQAPTYLYEDAPWFNDGAVDRQWLIKRWGCQNMPTCYNRDRAVAGV